MYDARTCCVTLFDEMRENIVHITCDCQLESLCSGCWGRCKAACLHGRNIGRGDALHFYHAVAI